MYSEIIIAFSAGVCVTAVLTLVGFAIGFRFLATRKWGGK